MSSGPPSPSDHPGAVRRHASQAAIPAAVLLLLALVAGLIYHARAAEQSHRATAERALRDYAAFAAWEFSRHALEQVRSSASVTVLPAYRMRLASGAALPSPSLLSRQSITCSCEFGKDVRLGFRVTLPSGTLDTDRQADAPTRQAIMRHLPEFRELAVALTDTGRDEFTEARPEWARVSFDTIAGESAMLMYTVMRDRKGVARAAYGVVGEPIQLGEAFTCIGDAGSGEPLLPPSLTRGAPNDSMLHVRLEYPGGGTAYALGAPTGGAHSASDTMPAEFGGLITVVELRPAMASSLLIGGVPQTRLPWLLALLGLAALLAALALVQLRRGRELTRLRSQFVANVSHELRTPLAQISMFSETLLLARERSPAERQHFLSVIFREARRLTTLVDGVLRFSRGEAGMTRLRLEPRDLVADAHETLQAFHPLAAAAHVVVRADLTDDAWVLADSGALRQILLNLLDNAVKYGPRGQTVTVRVETATAASGRSEVRVSVTDQGPGVDVADRERVFEPFARLEHAGQPRVPGSGIGLAVVRELVAAHGGRVWVESAAEPPHGAQMSFTLPALPAVTMAEHSATADQDATVPGSGMPGTDDREFAAAER